MKVTIEDVVKKSGVSYVTVSRVISNAPNVRESNRKKVLDAIEELGFIPSAAARTLATGKSFVIAMFVSNLGDDYMNSIIKEVNDQLLSKGYLLSLSICEEEDGPPNTSFLSQSRVDGAILLIPNQEKYFIEIFKSKKIPFVVIDNQTMDEDIPSVLSDNITGGYIATKHLIDLGHKKIGFIGARGYSLSTMERQLGANRALAETSLTPYAIMNGNYDQPTGYNAIMQWEKEGKIPEAIFAFDDHIAVGAINALKDLGLSVPKDVSVCGFDDSVLSNDYTPRITSLRQSTKEMAVSAIERLLATIDGRESASYAIRFSPKLVVKDSTSPSQK